jgi:hypothetical protein
MKRRDDAFLARRDSFLLGPDVSFPGEAEVSWVAEFAPSVENETHCRHKNRTSGDLEVAAVPPLAGEEVGQGRGTRPADVMALKSVLMNP